MRARVLGWRGPPNNCAGWSQRAIFERLRKRAITQEVFVANKDKGGKSEKKQAQKSLKEKRAAKKQKKK
jgi:hypothetical protein